MGYELKMKFECGIEPTFIKAKEKIDELEKEFNEEETRCNIQPFVMVGYENQKLSTKWFWQFWHGKKVWS